MTKQKAIRGFYRFSKSWYHNPTDKRQEVGFGLYDGKGGSDGEMIMAWLDISNATPSPQLQSFSDSWAALASFTDLLQALEKVNGKDITEEAFVEILKGCGFTDFTEYEKK